KREWRDWGNKRNYRIPNNSERGEVGWEPGIDVRHTEVELGENSSVTIIDYNSDRYRVVSKIDKDSIDMFLNEVCRMPKQEWASVRWINVNGLSWQVVRSISEFYNLHPLAIEDMVDYPKRAKADHYRNQTFCTLPLLKLINTAVIDEYFHAMEPYGILSKLLGKKKKPSLRAMNLNLIKIMAEQKMMSMQEWNNPSAASEYNETPRSLEKYHEVVAIEQVSIFLVEDHTIISFFENSADEVEEPILARIASASTLLREYPEPSLLLQALLDGIVDTALKIITEYQKYIAELQNDVLFSPSMSHTKELHILSEELATLKTTLMPINTLVTTLRDHANLSKVIGPTEKILAGGQISEFAKLYLADVADHVIAYTDNVDLMRHTTENMMNLIFNTMSVQENEAMRQLTLVTIVFLPLTFLTGYFGMNFTKFKALNNTTMYFWAIAIPVTVVVGVMISKDWIMAQWRRIRRKVAKRRFHAKHNKRQHMVQQLQQHETNDLSGYMSSDNFADSNGRIEGQLGQQQQQQYSNQSNLFSSQLGVANPGQYTRQRSPFQVSVTPQMPNSFIKKMSGSVLNSSATSTTSFPSESGENSSNSV
ncbi:hypothetical protein V1514DRAFT_355479, partial [Lipomyces japonicus]|uniref:uncharacterized protein n=1 Tax=Lipomyces japonicus TaxID=56871 RepID=UPI0034CD0FA0